MQWHTWDMLIFLFQFFSCLQKEVKAWMSNALKLQEEDWQANKKPELIDEYYVCHLHLDVIGVCASGWVNSFYSLRLNKLACISLTFHILWSK